jgi:hypothetical protein
VFVSNTPFALTDTPATLQSRTGTFGAHLTSFPNPSSSIGVNVTGRYVRVQLSGTNYLHLAEVQVFGSTAPPFVSASVKPLSAPLSVNQTEQFTATVSGALNPCPAGYRDDIGHGRTGPLQEATLSTWLPSPSLHLLKPRRIEAATATVLLHGPRNPMLSSETNSLFVPRIGMTNHAQARV